ncbi:MAG: hypothetical protein KDB03_14505 [Planctomycetales bacterium]|nr:hypothetical protein [Planctomycetales bacterium]
MRKLILPLFVLSCYGVFFAHSDAQEVQFGAVQVIGVTESGAEPSAGTQLKMAQGAAGIFLGSSPSFLGGVDPNSQSQLFQLLNNKSIRQELQLTEEQQQGVKTIVEESSKRISEAIRSSMADGGAGKISLNMKPLLEEHRAQAEAAIEEILLPDQLKRVRQLAFQIEIAQVGLGESLVNGRLGTEIGIYDDQKQFLTDRAAAIEAEVREQIAVIQTAARAKMFAELSPEQRKAAEELLGAYFSYEEESLPKLLRGNMQKQLKVGAKEEVSNKKSK